MVGVGSSDMPAHDSSLSADDDLVEVAEAMRLLSERMADHVDRSLEHVVSVAVDVAGAGTPVIPRHDPSQNLSMNPLTGAWVVSLQLAGFEPVCPAGQVSP